MAKIYQFVPPTKRKPCESCGIPFVPRRPEHALCLRCFQGVLYVRSIKEAHRWWDALTKGGAR